MNSVFPGDFSVLYFLYCPFSSFFVLFPRSKKDEKDEKDVEDEKGQGVFLGGRSRGDQSSIGGFSGIFFLNRKNRGNNKTYILETFLHK